MIIEDKLMKYVLFKKRTENEVRQKCKLLKYEENTIEEIIQYLKENDYINDEIYVQKYIQNVKRLKQASINEIKIDLMRRGVSSDLIEKHITEELEEFEEESAKILAKKKSKSMEIEKVKKYLLSKGYSYSNVAKAIDNFANLDDNEYV